MRIGLFAVTRATSLEVEGYYGKCWVGHAVSCHANYSDEAVWNFCSGHYGNPSGVDCPGGGKKDCRPRRPVEICPAGSVVRGVLESQIRPAVTGNRHSHNRPELCAHVEIDLLVWSSWEFGVGNRHVRPRKLRRQEPGGELLGCQVCG